MARDQSGDNVSFGSFRLKDTRTHLNKLWSSGRKERESFIPHWRDLTEHIKPRRGRYLREDRNRGNKRHQSIVNSRATQALRTATSGMLAGTMSPTRPWFALETQNLELMDRQAVKEWLHKVEQVMRTIFNESNLYGQASTMLSELLLFGTAAMSHEDDFEDVARFYTHTAGSYMVQQNHRYQIDTFHREFMWDAPQMVKEFGYKNCSKRVRDAWDRGDYNNWYPIRHLIEPNSNYRGDNPSATNMPYISIYYEPDMADGTRVPEGKLLKVSGFQEFPLYAPRWDVTAEDVYGTDCPGMTSLGDVRQLQTQERDKLKAVQKMHNPPLTGPASVRNVPVRSLPGGLTVYDAGVNNQNLEPLYQVDPRVQELRADIDAVEKRIEEAFFVDLFLAISNIEGIQPRNQLDLMQRNEERLLQLGPVLERIHGEFLQPLVDRTFNQCIRAGILPPIPEELQGQELRVKFISTLAMAQRAVATQGIDRLTQYTGALLELGFEDVRKKFDAKQAVDAYAEAVGVAPTLVVPDEEVQRMEMAEQQAIQQQRLLDQAQQAAQVARDASQAKTDDSNVLTEIAQRT